MCHLGIGNYATKVYNILIRMAKIYKLTALLPDIGFRESGITVN
jgi:hypothetical protein